MTSNLPPFESLTLRGSVRRMRALAWNALAQYEVKVTRLQYLGWFTNLMFRVETANGQHLVLRICTPNWRTDEDRQAEVAWLLALAEDPEIHAPVPLPARNGACIVEADAPGVPGTRQCLLMSWIPGVNLGKQLNEANLTKMGVLFAKMHTQSSFWTPPAGFTTRKMERVLARGEPEALFAPAAQESFTPHTRRVWEQAQEIVKHAYTQLYSQVDRLQVIHHDLWHDNIKLHRGRLYPLDFEDTVWGYPVQDIAMAMQDLMQDVPPERYEPLLEAFRRGYKSLQPWPEAYEGEMDIFRVGRMLWVANYVAHRQTQYLQDHLERNSLLLEAFLATGKLRKE